MKKRSKAAEGLTIDKFGEIIDGFLKENPVQMLIEMPEGTMECEVTDNTGCGEVIQFYIMLHAIGPIYKGMCEKVGIDPAKNNELIDAIVEMIADALRDEFK